MRTFDSLIPSSVTVSSLTTNEDEENNISSVNFTVVALYYPVSHDADEAEEAE